MPGRTRYTSDDTITGILAPLVMLVYGRPMQRGFESAWRSNDAPKSWRRRNVRRADGIGLSGLLNCPDERKLDGS